MDTYHVIVVGAGPAGMMAALRAAQSGAIVGLFEKNASLGRKLGLTGKGRCNLTNDSSLEEFLKNFGKNGPFLRNAFKRFFVRELMDFFEKRGCRLKVERQQRVFPASDDAKDVVGVLKDSLAQAGVKVHLSSPVKDILAGEGGTKGVRLENGETFAGPKVIMATGGLSYPETGSTGDGLRMAKDTGHRAEELHPGLVPLETEEKFVKELQGLTLKNIRIVLRAGSRQLESDVGELLFTHFGVSGPLVLDLSAETARLLDLSARDEKGKLQLSIDLKPGLSFEQMGQKLERDLRASGALMIKNYLCGLLPNRLVEVFLALANLEPQKRCNQVTSRERQKIVELLKKFPLTVTRTRPLSEAMVTSGGVSLKDVDPATLESRKVAGLYFCGEVLGLAAKSGGFNLQAAFSTGFLAGESATLSLGKS